MLSVKEASSTKVRLNYSTVCVAVWCFECFCCVSNLGGGEEKGQQEGEGREKGKEKDRQTDEEMEKKENEEKVEKHIFTCILFFVHFYTFFSFRAEPKMLEVEYGKEIGIKQLKSFRLQMVPEY